MSQYEPATPGRSRTWLLAIAATSVALVVVLVMVVAIRSDGSKGDGESGSTPDIHTAPPSTQTAPSDATLTADDLVSIVLTGAEVGMDGAVNDAYTTGFRSNAAHIADDCDPDEDMDEVASSGRIDEYRRSFVDVKRRAKRAGVFQAGTSAELFHDAAGALMWNDFDSSIEALKAEAEIGVADCDGATIYSASEFPTQPLGDRVRGLTISGANDDRRMYYVTAVSFTRGRLSLSVVMTSFDAPTAATYTRVEELAQRLDARYADFLAGKIVREDAVAGAIRRAEGLAAAAKVEVGDLPPTGWDVAAPGDDGSAGDYQLADDCAGVDSLILPEAIGTSQSDDFENQYKDTLSVAISAFSDGATAQSAMRSLDQALERCGDEAAKLVRSSITDGIRQQGGSLSQLDEFTVESEDVALPDIADGHGSHRVRAVVRADEVGVAFEIVTDFIFVRHDALVAVIVYQAVAEPRVTAADEQREVELVRTVAAKLESATATN